MIVKYKDIKEVITHYFQCSQNNSWENFNFEDAFKILSFEIYEVLCEYGQCDEEFFVAFSLEMTFPWYLLFNPCNFDGLGYDLKQIAQKAFEIGNKYSLFEEFISVCEEIGTKRFHELQKQYKDNPEIRYLDNVIAIIDAVNCKEVIDISQSEMISILKMALHAKHPTRNVFNLNIE